MATKARRIADYVVGLFVNRTNGNVGIGTEAPFSRLHVRDSSTAIGSDGIVLLDAASSDVDSGAQITFRNIGARRAAIAGRQESAVGFSGYLQFGTRASTGDIAERMRIDSAGNVGIGTSSTTNYILRVNAASPLFGMMVNGTQAFTLGALSGGGGAFYYGSGNAEAMRIDASGSVLVGATSFVPGQNSKSINQNIIQSTRNATGQRAHLQFFNPNGQVGSIETDGSATIYATSSDYRLKEDVQPMTGALAKVAQLKPCTYRWKADGTAGEGFIAHELKSVVPQAVIGEKDAVDEDGKPQYQAIDTSFLVATLTAAMQEQQAIIEQLKARVEALENA